MTATETPPEAHEHVEEHNGSEVSSDANDGLYKLVASNDHKDVGRLWIGASLLFAVAILALGIVNNIERISVDPDLFGSVSRAFQSWVLFRTAAIFLVVIPMFIGIATVVTPLQVGSASIAFPRLAAASFWGWLFGSVIHIVSFLADGGLGPAQTTSVESTLLTMTSLGFIIVALLGGSICIATTVVALRPTGMALIDVPAFSWSMLVACSIWLVSLPVLIASLILGYVDLQGRAFVDFGNPELLWQRVEWAWGQPQVFAYAIPVLGVLAEIVPVKSQSRQAARPVLLGMITAFGALSFGAWAQSFYSKGADENVNSALIYDELLYVLFGIAIFLPAFGAFSGAMDQLRRGTFPMKPDGALFSAMFGAFALLGAIIAGELRVLAGLLDLVGVDPSWSALDSADGVLLSSSSAILTMVIAAAMASAAGALIYWGPKIFGGYVVEPLGILAGLLLLGGGVAVGIADMASAFAGNPDDPRFVTDVDGIVSTMNVLAVAGVALMTVGVIATIVAVLPAARSTELLPDDPWDGHTLEWAAPSPPPSGNFVEPIPVVRSPEPMLDEIGEA